MKSVSVIIPVFNMERYLKDCLSSVRNQSLDNLEIICINDGSTDSSLKILEENASVDKRITLINQSNMGVSFSRNLGIEVAKGDYIAFLDPDDFYPDNDVLKDLYEMSLRDNTLIAGGSFSEVDNCGNFEFFDKTHPYKFSKNEITKYKNYQFDYGYHRFIYKKSFLIANDIKFPPYKRFQDPPFFIKSMVLAETFSSMERVSYCYRKGHQRINWDEERIHHLLLGLRDNMIFAAEYDLRVLACLTLERINNDFKDVLIRGLIQSEENQFLLLFIKDLFEEKFKEKIEVTPLLIYISKWRLAFWGFKKIINSLLRHGLVHTKEVIKSVLHSSGSFK